MRLADKVMAQLGLIAKKIGMTRMVDDKGHMIPVTLLQVAPQKITKVLSNEKEGYTGIQVGYWAKPDHRMNKPDVARLRKASVETNFTRFREFRLDTVDDALVSGADLTIEVLDGIGSLDATGLSKGKGFQGAIKRWGSSQGRKTHGSHHHNRPGSLGANTTPGRCMKNRKMPGQTGNKRKTIQNLKVVDLDKEQSIVAVKGSVPGFRNSYLVLKPSLKVK